MCKRVFMSTVIVPGVCVLVCMGGGDLHERPGNLMTGWIILCHGPLVPPSHIYTDPPLPPHCLPRKLYPAVFIA